MDKGRGVALQEFEEGFFFCPNLRKGGSVFVSESFVLGDEALVQAVDA